MRSTSLPTLRLRIDLLGGFRIAIDGEPADPALNPAGLWSRRSSRNLVKLLAIARKHEMLREEVLNALWPELNGEQALNSFHKALHAARRALEPELRTGALSSFLLTQDQKVALRAPGGVAVDALEFEKEARAALGTAHPEPLRAERLRAALQLYRGALLPEDRLEDWTAIFREQLANLHQQLLLTLAAAEEQRGDAPAAIECLLEAIAIEPANEQAHRELMRLYAITSRRHLALNQYRLLTERLRRDLDAEPEPNTVDLHARILDGSISPPATSAAPESQSPALANPTSGPPLAGRTTTRRPFLWGGLAAGTALGATVFALRDRLRPQRPNSLAVLPFTVLGDPQLEYLGDGLSEGLIDGLSHLEDLRVMARSTVFAYRGTGRSPREVGHAVGAGTVLTGQIIQPPQGKPQVTMELVDAADGARLWGGRYPLDPAGLPSLTARMTADVARVLSRTLAAPQRERLAKRASSSPKAFQLYLYGLYHSNKRNREEFLKAIQFFEQAIAEDPSFALAYAGLADCHGLLSFDGGQTHQHMPQARRFAEQAISLNEQLAEGHTSLAMVNALYEWRWSQAEAGFRRAIELNPSHATAHHWYAVHLNGQGRRQEAEAEFARALSLDPQSAIVLTNAGYPAYYAREYPAAVQAYRNALAVDRNFLPAHHDLMLAYEQASDYARALEAAATVLSLGGDHTLAGIVRAAAGSPVSAQSYAAARRRWQSALEEQAKAVYVAPLALASLAARNGDRPAAFRWLFQGLEERSAPLVYLKADPQYDPIREDPRFAQLLGRIGLV